MSIDKNAAAFVASQLNLPPASILKVLTLAIEEDCTVPFISRYRKEATGGLDEVAVGNILENYNGFIEREKRREYIFKTIEEMGKMTDELAKSIAKATTLNQLEDIYAPYKSKRKTKGQKAIEAGLGPLAEIIKTSSDSFSDIMSANLQNFINKEAGYESEEQVIDGIRSIICEEIAHNVEIKDQLRKDYWRSATLVAEKKKEAEEIKDFDKYRDYFEFEQKISELTAAKIAHRFLALRRGMAQKVLKVSVTYPEEQALGTISSMSFDLSNLGCANFLDECVKRAYRTSLHTSLDLEIKSELKLKSDESAIEVFGVNLKNLLLQPYLGQKAVIGIDPGVRTGCKVAVIDKNGNYLVDTVIYPHEPKFDIEGSKKVIEDCIKKLGIEYIAVGNGTFGRETLHFLKDHIQEVSDGKVKAMLVNEDGASIYSASEIARKEFPDKDLTVRGAISIARRFQDPLGELVKIDPKSIGVGQYQHDVNQAKLKKSLGTVIENCVNFVGVDLNTASAPLLSYISGIGPKLAENIVSHRSKISGFKMRDELLGVGRFTPKIFEQSAGFLRIYNGENPLDSTFIHPERYTMIEAWCQKNGISIADLIGNSELVAKLKNDKEFVDSVGDFTADDISKSLLAPSQDPRTEFQPFEYRKDAKEIKDLKVNQYYPGIVTNITQFGAFVDIGIKENGLIHVSQISDKFVENPLEELKVGQEVNARILDVDLGRKRISLTLKSEGVARTQAHSEPSKQNSNNHKGKRPNNKPRRAQEETLKNNPFAALKGMKFK